MKLFLYLTLFHLLRIPCYPNWFELTLPEWDYLAERWSLMARTPVHRFSEKMLQSSRRTYISWSVSNYFIGVESAKLIWDGSSISNDMVHNYYISLLCIKCVFIATVRKWWLWTTLWITQNCILKYMYYKYSLLYLVSSISSISPFRNERKPSDSAVQSNNATLIDPEN